jgi:hypothetical protein
MTMQHSRKTVWEQLLEGLPLNRNPQHRRHVMSKQLTHRRATRRATRTLAVGVAVAALVGIVGAGQALAAVAVPDERVLERQGRIDNQPAASQADEQGKAEEPAQGPSTRFSRRFFKPEPPVHTGPPLDADEQAAPAPAPPPPAADRDGLVVIVMVALLLAVGATTTWRIHHRGPPPESTA